MDHAVKHEEISYDEMLEMSSLGAKILHNRSVGMAKQSGVQFEVLSSFDGQRGTLIHDFSRENCVSGIVCDDNVAMISAIGIDSGGLPQSCSRSLLRTTYTWTPLYVRPEATVYGE